ncbi:MAG: glycerol-3-phosphate 1-O-acyltransferase PlsY [Clostridia bacterium]|nr:glycerol-3-phosphate 1-O-acyltransferase PlsY [Clostridia bacterium]MBQ1374882.1 glycerol-3-phosphate 1-O-acyltransferase PlsY [Clostridia bacterium]MBQ1434915.1 glycerol-3-phosphate 1-O-acyltransferase PlsY [Clostridia bacterium]MBQ4249069.1 glycerol-3-phosphate 1-O-acyltransferase PlsY [Clostridia bacterium]
MPEGIWRVVITIIIGYLLGSISFSLVIGKLVAHKDVRQYGSGNAGTTNVLRVLGKKAALAVLVGDILKCLAAVIIGGLFIPVYGGWIGGIACMVGHVFPVFFKFKGGKAVATGFAVMAFACPMAGFPAVGVFFVVFAITRIVSVSSLAAFLSFPFFVWLFVGEPVLILVAAAMFVFVLILHRENIKRLIRGEEKKISFKSLKK